MWRKPFYLQLLPQSFKAIPYKDRLKAVYTKSHLKKDKKNPVYRNGNLGLLPMRKPTLSDFLCTPLKPFFGG